MLCIVLAWLKSQKPVLDTVIANSKGLSNRIVRGSAGSSARRLDGPALRPPLLIGGGGESLKPKRGLLPEILVGVTILDFSQKGASLSPVDRMAGSE